LKSAVQSILVGRAGQFYPVTIGVNGTTIPHYTAVMPTASSLN